LCTTALHAANIDYRALADEHAALKDDQDVLAYLGANLKAARRFETLEQLLKQSLLTIRDAAALDPGTAPVAAIAALPVSGPSAGVLLVGLAQKPVCAGCAGGVGADRALAPGAVIGSVRLRLVPAAGAGPVFGPGALDAIHGFRSAVRSGATGASVGTVAVGTLSGSSPRARRL
jgi:hypothetical protein